MSIVLGGPGFPFLHRHVYLYLCTDLWSPISIPPHEIPDHDVRDLVDKVIQLHYMQQSQNMHVLYSPN